MTSEFKILTVKQVAKALNVSTNFVYNHKRALGAFQACRSGRLLFSEKELQEIIRRRDSYAIPREERQVARAQDDRRQKADKIVQKQKCGKKMGGNVQPRGREDENRHGLFD